MRTKLSLFALLLAATCMAATPNEKQLPTNAQPANKGVQQGGKEKRNASRVFQILVKNADNIEVVQNMNRGMKKLEAERGYTDLLTTAFGTSFTQKTVNATSNLVDLGISYVTKLFKGHEADWEQEALKTCEFSKKLAPNCEVGEFYCQPSTKGAMDPENIVFDGFGARNYLEDTKDKGHGAEVFYFMCKMKRDDKEGLPHIYKYSKFLVELDTLAFNPKLCDLAIDKSGDPEIDRFDFVRRQNLQFDVKVRLYSSWMNQATILCKDQLLGEFTIHANIDPKFVKDDMFIYSKADSAKMKNYVWVEGDCFIVPRSYTGTTDAKTAANAWGTGQYRIEMELCEKCELNEKYYYIPSYGRGEKVTEEGLPGKKKYNKAVWKVEWNRMKERQKDKSIWQNMLDAVTTAYKGNGWASTFLDPVTTTLYKYETEKLNDWLDLNSESSGGKPAAKAAGGASAEGSKGGSTTGEVGGPKDMPKGEGGPKKP